jgi:threonine/homoserine/homoserine lactone efflux protein
MSGDGQTGTPVTRVDHRARPRRLERWRGRSERWLGLIVVLGAVALKADAYGRVVQHRAEIMAALGVALLVSVLRPRPIVFALLAAPFVALALHPHPLLVGVGVGFGVFVLVVALSFAIATVLHVRQRRR